MDIRKCTPDDIESINDLMSLVKFNKFPVEMFEDITIGAFSDGICHGFIWAGVIDSGYLAYMDFLAVTPGTRGIGTRIIQEMWNLLGSMGVQKVMAVVQYSGTDNEEKSLALTAKIGMTPLSKPYHFCLGDMERGRLWAP